MWSPGIGEKHISKESSCKKLLCSEKQGRIPEKFTDVKSSVKHF